MPFPTSSSSINERGSLLENNNVEEGEHDLVRPTSSAPGAPLENVSPLGEEVTLFSATMLNIGQILGSGVFAIQGVILHSIGSLGLFFLAWIVAPLFALAGVMLYGELSEMFPKRSGGEVVYLEQAYPNPPYLVPVSFALMAIMLSFSATQAIVFAQYMLSAVGIPVTPSTQSLVAVAVVTTTTLLACLSTKWSLKAVNVLSVFKILSLMFVIAVGLAVFSGITQITDPFENFHNIFENGSSNANSISTALIKVNMCFAGWHNAFNVLAEVRDSGSGITAVGTVRRAGLLSICMVAILYFLVNLAYVAAIPREELANSGQLVAALFFQKVFGPTSVVTRFLPIMVAGSCVGNITAVTVGQARMIREIARQGLLPYPSFFASTRPFGTPLGPILLKYGMTLCIILIIPARDAYSFLIDLVSYPSMVFSAATVVGVWRLRRRRAAAGVLPAKYQAWNSAIILYMLWAIFLLVMPWVPPEPGHSDVSFWYATYCVAGLGILAACGVYYYVWMVLLPKRGGYEIVEEVQYLEGGARNTRLIRRYPIKLGDDEDGSTSLPRD